MAVQNCIGDSFRGATWVALHNGGGVGWGEVINGGFGLVLDGSAEAESRARNMLQWDVSNGVCPPLLIDTVTALCIFLLYNQTANTDQLHQVTTTSLHPCV